MGGLVLQVGGPVPRCLWGGWGVGWRMCDRRMSMPIQKEYMNSLPVGGVSRVGSWCGGRMMCDRRE